jgi:hypothetical protein
VEVTVFIQQPQQIFVLVAAAVLALFTAMAAQEAAHQLDLPLLYRYTAEAAVDLLVMVGLQLILVAALSMELAAAD